VEVKTCSNRDLHQSRLPSSWGPAACWCRIEKGWPCFAQIIGTLALSAGR